QGTATYLHVPSPGLLELFLRDGARRFVFEGRECGGHVGPRSSFALWEAQLERLLAHPDAARVSVLFAGGIHDARSAAMVAAFADEAGRLITEGVGAKERWAALEQLNLGRLRIAAKGLRRDGASIAAVDDTQQRAEGMYMIGQAAALRNDACSVADLHEEVS